MEKKISPLDGMLVHRRVTPSIKFAGPHFYTWVRVKCLAQEQNTMSGWPGLKPGLPNPETSALTPWGHCASTKPQKKRTEPQPNLKKNVQVQ